MLLESAYLALDHSPGPVPHVRHLSHVWVPLPPLFYFLVVFLRLLLSPLVKFSRWYNVHSRKLPSHAPLRLDLVAPRTVLGRPQLVHLGYPLLELDILALLVGVSLLL